MSSFFATGDQSYEKKTLLFLLLAVVGFSVQIFMLGLAILLIFTRLLPKFEFSARKADQICLNTSVVCKRVYSRRCILFGIHRHAGKNNQYQQIFEASSYFYVRVTNTRDKCPTKIYSGRFFYMSAVLLCMYLSLF